MKILIMTDSRGTGLDQRITEDMQKRYPTQYPNLNIIVRVMRGAVIENIITKMDKLFPTYSTYDMIYTMVGVNNLTSKCAHGKVEPNFDDIPELVESLSDKLSILKTDLKKRAKYVIIGQIVGLDMDRYNEYYAEGRWFYQQIVLNQAIPMLANTTNCINKENDVYSPWIANTVHEYVNHKLYNKYRKLKDGLHPSSQTLTKWAKLFSDAIVMNYTNKSKCH